MSQTKVNSAALQKAKDNEPIFVLRGQDKSSPKLILAWMAENFENLSNQRLQEAFDTLMAMKRWPNRKHPD
jgi:hypothetical protein